MSEKVILTGSSLVSSVFTKVKKRIVERKNIRIMNKVKTMEEAYQVFDLLGIKNVTKKWQKANGSEVWELPFKTMYANGYSEVNRFTIYKSGYVRKMLVNPESNASYSCYQLNKTRKSEDFHKYYEWNDDFTEQKWTGKYVKSKRKERIMIPNHADRVVYLCNYILKNYYRNQRGASFYRINDYQVNLMHEYCKDSHKLDKIQRPESYDLPFEETVERDSFIDNNEIKVIINGHRYNLS